jgi:hypothetical protein
MLDKNIIKLLRYIKTSESVIKLWKIMIPPLIILPKELNYIFKNLVKI